MPTGLNTARLYSQLQITGLAQKDQPLYQLIRSLINDLVQVGNQTSSGGSGGGSNVTNNIVNQTIAQLISDSSSGEDGLPGPPGVAGIQGIQGIPGAAGSSSGIMLAEDGIDGYDSLIPGPQGIQGITGSIGPTGPSGASLTTVVPGQDGEDGQDYFFLLNALSNLNPEAQLLVAQAIITPTQFRTLSSVPIVIVPAAGPDTIIIPLGFACKTVISGVMASNPSTSLRYSGVTTDITSATGVSSTADRFVFSPFTLISINTVSTVFNVDVVIKNSADVVGGATPTGDFRFRVPYLVLYIP